MTNEYATSTLHLQRNSIIRNKWDIAGLCFLNSEVKEKVLVGMEFFKEYLHMASVDVNGNTTEEDPRTSPKWKDLPSRK